MLIEPVSQVTQELQDAMRRLVPQLSPRLPPSQQELRLLVASEASSLFVARAEPEGQIIGIACLTVYRVPTGIRAIIEDVVVDQDLRGKGVGEALVRRCLNIARQKGAGAVVLTSNPAREAANRLYLRMGFTLRDTNSYIYRFS